MKFKSAQAPLQPTLFPPMRSKFFGHALVYTVSTLATQLITAAASILSRRFLGPVQTGIWSAFQILIDYSKYSNLGMMSAVSRDIPYLIGQGHTEQAERVKNAAASFTLAGAGVVAGLILLSAWPLSLQGSSQLAWGVVLAAAVIVLQRANNLLIALLRCYQRFDIESRLMVISALVNSVLVGILSYYFKIYGFMAAMILSFVFNLVFVLSSFPFRIRWVYDPALVKTLVAFGFPLMLLGLAMTLLRSLDKIMILKFMGLEPLGWYSIALMMMAYINNFPNAIQTVLIPNFQVKLGQAGNPREMSAYLSKSAEAIGLSLAVLIALVWVAAPWLIRWFLPQFTAGIDAMKLLGFSVFFMAVGQVFYDALINIKKHFRAFPVVLISIAVTALLQFAAIAIFGTITAVALATSLGAGVYFLSALLLVQSSFYDLRQTGVQFAKFFGLAAYLLLFYSMLERVGTVQTIRTAGLELALLLFFSATILAVMNRRFSVFDQIRLRLKGFGGAV